MVIFLLQEVTTTNFSFGMVTHKFRLASLVSIALLLKELLGVLITMEFWLLEEVQQIKQLNFGILLITLSLIVLTQDLKFAI
jgi:hypothetical protein